MLKYRVTKRDYKKIARQAYWEKLKRLLIVAGILLVIEIYSLIVGLTVDSTYLNGAYGSLILLGILAIALLVYYIRITLFYKRYDEGLYQITYNRETINIVNELTNNSIEVKTVDLRLTGVYKSYLLFVVPADVERLLVVPRNAETKEFEEYFSLKSTV